MGTLADKLQAVADSKAAIKAALTDKGRSPSDVFSSYGDEILAIEGGGGEETPEAPLKAINFYDYDGKRLYSYSVEEAQQLTELPLLPEHEGLIAEEWTHTLARVKAATDALDVGASFVTDDGKTRLYIELIGTLRMTVPLYFYQPFSQAVTVDWGDGSEAEPVNTPGSAMISHTYENEGTFCITMSVGVNPIKIGSGDTSVAFVGGANTVYRTALKRVEIGNGVTEILRSAFEGCYALRNITIPKRVWTIGNRAFAYCRGLQNIIIPNGNYSYGSNMFQDCNNLKRVILPFSINTTNIIGSMFYYCESVSNVVLPANTNAISAQAFYYCSSLQNIVIPNKVTSIGNNAFQNCVAAKEYHLQRTTPPTLGTSAFAGIAGDCIIYVPVGSLDAYKTATNWSTYASYIKEEGT